MSGGTYGIGRGIVLDLARRGWNVVAFGLDGKQPGSAADNGIAGTRGALAAEGLKADVIEAKKKAEADAKKKKDDKPDDKKKDEKPAAEKKEAPKKVDQKVEAKKKDA